MLSSRIYYNQTSLADKINHYLKSKKRKKTVENAYCHGLSLLWLYKMMEGKEQWFYDTIKRIITHKGKDFSDIEMDLEKLLAHIEWLQNSNMYMNSVQQEDVHQLLDFSHNLKLSFILSQAELERVLALVVPQSKMMCISGPDHSIGVFNRNGSYYLFDSNYDKGKAKSFKRIKCLKTELIKCLFLRLGFEGRKLPLSMNIIHDGGGKDKKLQFSKTKKMVLLNELNSSSVEVNQVSVEGLTPLYVASDNGDLDAVKFYLARGADLNYRGKDMGSAISLASEKGYVQIVNVFLNQGANPNLRNQDGTFPLYYAAMNGHEEVVRLLLFYNAKINLANKDGETALHVAVRENQNQVIELLLKSGANCLSKNKAKLSPFQLALMKENWPMLAAMLDHLDHISALALKDVHFLKLHQSELKEAAQGLRYWNLKKQSALNELLNTSKRMSCTFFQPKRLNNHKRKREEADVQVRYSRRIR